MRFKNSLRSRPRIFTKLRDKKAQAIVEYIVIFIVLAAGILAIFGAFNPQDIGIRTIFNQAVNNAITQIQR